MEYPKEKPTDQHKPAGRDIRDETFAGPEDDNALGLRANGQYDAGRMGKREGEGISRENDATTEGIP